MMQAHSFFIGGLPMIFYGDELGYTNDYSYQEDEGKHYDNRWMHRPVIDWKKNERINEAGTTEKRIFSGTQRLIEIRRTVQTVSDFKNLTWLPPHNIHVAGYLRTHNNKKLYCVFNFSSKEAWLTMFAFKQHGPVSSIMFDHWRQKEFTIGYDHEYFILEPYGFYLLEPL